MSVWGWEVCRLPVVITFTSPILFAELLLSLLSYIFYIWWYLQQIFRLILRRSAQCSERLLAINCRCTLEICGPAGNYMFKVNNTRTRYEICSKITKTPDSCVKNVRICCFSGSFFPAFGLNTEYLSVFNPNAGKYGPENTEYGDSSRSVNNRCSFSRSVIS